LCRSADPAIDCDADDHCNGTSEACLNLGAPATQACSLDSYTGPEPNADNCSGANNCGPNAILNCFDQFTCHGTGFDCDKCRCVCESIEIDFAP
jgi:hypothetical protein